eukprot:TRINITY_DN1693_c0_g1_i2.p1 TRINITY_DN1693_c0_g1~~TRINITY_DN1693_c0_g1_i2.p1  ORF type:complete len:131 (-),score=46.18 TRINITY_DN1693_c0_g1_i2:79-471(-)
MSAALNGDSMSAKPFRNWEDYHSKYDPKEVLSLRDFYTTLREDVAAVRGKGTLMNDMRIEEVRRKMNRQMAVTIFNGMLGHNPQSYKFKQLLAIIYPNATKREVASMIKLAFPNGEEDVFNEDESVAETH